MSLSDDRKRAEEEEERRRSEWRLGECLGKPARYWYDAFQIAEGLRADAERRVQELKSQKNIL